MDDLFEREQTADVMSGDVADLSSANVAGQLRIRVRKVKYTVEAYRVLS